MRRRDTARVLTISTLALVILVPVLSLAVAQVANKQAPAEPQGGPVIWELDSYIYNEEDPTDWYFFHAPDAGPFVVTLTNIPDHCDFDLYLREQVGDQPSRHVAHSGRYGNKDESIEFTAVPGRKYLVEVRPDPTVPNNHSSVSQYHLELRYQ